MKIYIDADACPVTDIIIDEAQKRKLDVVVVKSYSHYSTAQDPIGVNTIYVDTGVDAADYRILQLAKKHDFIITQDYGLASLALGKGCIVLHHIGFQYTHKNIDQLLQSRHANAKARKAGFKTKGPKALTTEDKEAFRALFIKTLDQHSRLS